MSYNIPKTWRDSTKQHFQDFMNQTEYRIPYVGPNGYIGVGTLKKPEDHGKAKEVNKIVIMWHCTFEDVKVSFGRFAVTNNEAGFLLKAINNSINELKNKRNNIVNG